MDLTIIFKISILIISVMIHEISHGYMALFWGDRTAQYEGRLTLNPIKHIDIFGSIIIPALMFLSGTDFIFGWAKPVPYNPYNLRRRNIAEPFVALAGPLSNIIVAAILSIILRVGLAFSLPEAMGTLLVYAVLINISLAIFNMMPVPGFDGYKIYSAFLPDQIKLSLQSLEKYWIIFALAFVLFASPFFVTIVEWVFRVFIVI
ncbi:MAG: site-2 protease family protein [Minisyncoccia bacterium]